MKWAILSAWLLSCSAATEPPADPRPLAWATDYIRTHYYIPRYSELGFSPPSLILRRCPAPAVDPQTIHRGDSASGLVALTFDACSDLRENRFDSAVVAVLMEKRASATFFLGGKWAMDLPEETRRLASIPYFEIASHSYFHSHLPGVSKPRLDAEIRWGRDVLYTLTGVAPTCMRPPYIESSEAAVEMAAALGMVTVIGDVASGDPAPTASKDRLLSWILWKVRAGSVVIMHVNGKGWHTAEVMPVLIDSLRGRGYSLVTVSQLAGL